ncbi:H2.0-Like Homeobox Protein [Manis pentadactyla]|nr:H2.0-Like Homeobox Protein [Manis pentadactyla]
MEVLGYMGETLARGGSCRSPSQDVAALRSRSCTEGEAEPQRKKRISRLHRDFTLRGKDTPFGHPHTPDTGIAASEKKLDSGCVSLLCGGMISSLVPITNPVA